MIDRSSRVEVFIWLWKNGMNKGDSDGTETKVVTQHYQTGCTNGTSTLQGPKQVYSIYPRKMTNRTKNPLGSWLGKLIKSRSSGPIPSQGTKAICTNVGKMIRGRRNFPRLHDTGAQCTIKPKPVDEVTLGI